MPERGKPDNTNKEAVEKPKYRRTLAKYPHEKEDELQEKLRKRCVHEAAHVIVLDERGYKTKKVSVASGNQKAEPDYRGHDQLLMSNIWDDPVEREAHKQIVFDQCDTLCAGHLAENEGPFPKEPTVNDRITDKMLADGLFGKEDADKVCYFLKKIRRNTRQHVLDAEERARKVLRARKADHEALAEALYDREVMEWKDIAPIIHSKL